MARRAFALALALAAPLSACAPQADFGRPQANAVNDELLPWAGRHLARGREEPASTYPFTDAERDMRQLGYALIMPGHPADRWNYFWAELRRTRVGPSPAYAPDPEGYCRALYHEAYRSSRSRFLTIADNARADRQRIPPFFAKSREVAEADRVRMGATTYIANLTPAQLQHARDRVAENEMVVRWVREGLASRLNSYRCALNRLIVATPEHEAVLAEREIAGLERDIADLDRRLGAQPAPRAEHVRPYFPVNRRIEVESVQRAPETPDIK